MTNIIPARHNKEPETAKDKNLQLNINDNTIIPTWKTPGDIKESLRLKSKILQVLTIIYRKNNRACT